MDGHLSMDLVKTSEVEEKFQALSAAAFKKKYAVVFPFIDPDVSTSCIIFIFQWFSASIGGYSHCAYD